MRSTLLAAIFISLVSPAINAATISELWSGTVFSNSAAHYISGDAISWTITYDDGADRNPATSIDLFTFTPGNDFFQIFENMDPGFDRDTAATQADRTKTLAPPADLLNWNNGSDQMGYDDGLGSTYAQFTINQGSHHMFVNVTSITPNPVPVPAAVWLFGSALAGLGFVTRKRRQTA